MPLQQTVCGKSIEPIQAKETWRLLVLTVVLIAKGWQSSPGGIQCSTLYCR